MLCEADAARSCVVAPIDDRGELRARRVRAAARRRARSSSRSRTSRTRSAPSTRCARSSQLRARARRRRCCVDGAQAVPHLPVDVQALGCDFYAFSGHKLYGPTGIGVLCGRARAARGDAAWQGGGDMIRVGHASRRRPTPTIPYKFEAGTPEHRRRGRPRRGDRLRATRSASTRSPRTSSELLALRRRRGSPRCPGLRLVGTRAARRPRVVSFVLDGVHPHDVGTILDREGVAVRTGHHCAQPRDGALRRRRRRCAPRSRSTTRASDVDALVARRSQRRARGVRADVATCASSTRR